MRRQATALLALVGFFIALYLWLHALGVIGQLTCGTGSCEAVQASRYAMFAGVPVALYGVVGYFVLFVVSLVGATPANRSRRQPDLALAALASIGFAFTLYLTVIEVFVLHELCRWCVASAVIITLIWLLSLTGLRRAA
ncbi:MAG TPA: vitamin K epoxide reductase family protein [Gemmatimonadales bacterium]|nr:vitamin K epoxide reductase family protein [Gemmatimonadales bacterium]